MMEETIESIVQYALQMCEPYEGRDKCYIYDEVVHRLSSESVIVLQMDAFSEEVWNQCACI
jgi:hypothetical protein